MKGYSDEICDNFSLDVVLDGDSGLWWIVCYFFFSDISTHSLALNSRKAKLLNVIILQFTNYKVSTKYCCMLSRQEHISVVMWQTPKIRYCILLSEKWTEMWNFCGISNDIIYDEFLEKFGLNSLLLNSNFADFQALIILANKTYTRSNRL